jgi:competence protein ComEC
MNWLRHGLQFFALSVAAWVGSIPLSAKYFNLFSLISPLANVVAVPLGICALTSNLGSLVCGGWFPWGTVAFNHSAWLFMLLMTRVSEITASWPAAYWYVAAWSWPVIGIYYAIVVAAFSGGLRLVWQTPARIGLVAGVVAAAGLVWWAWAVARPEVRLTVLPLNGSQTVFVGGGGPAGRCLINCGNAVEVDATLKPFLRAQGVNHLPRLILTTGEMDSCGGAERLNQLFRVDELFTSATRARSKVYRDYVADYDQTRHEHQTLHLNDPVAGWQVLHPGPADAFAHADDNALVLRGTFFSTTILLLSDLGREGQSALLNRTNALRADVVVASVPLQGEPLCEPLLQAIRPHLIIITDAEYPIPRRAGAGLKERLAATGIPVIYTRESGAVTLVAGPGGWEAESMAGERLWFDAR